MAEQISMFAPVLSTPSGLQTNQLDTGLPRPVTMTAWYNDTEYYDSSTSENPLGGYQYPSLYSTTHVILSSVFVTVIMLIIVAGNVLVMVAVGVDRNLKGTQNWFIASLAVSDLLVGLFIMPLSLANELMGYWPFGDVLCQLWLSTDVLLCTASILNLVLISLDRYWSITKAVSYVRGRTKRRAVVMIAVVWLLSMVICFPPLVGWKRPQPMKFGFPLCILSEEPGYVVYSTIGSFYLPLIVMVIVYFKIYLVARGHARRHRRKYAPNGVSTFSVGQDVTLNFNASQRNHSERSRFVGENSRISEVPEISSDLSNSLQTVEPDQEPQRLTDTVENCVQTTEVREEEIPVQLCIARTTSDRRTPPCRRHTAVSDAATTDSQGDTPTRFLLPNNNNNNNNNNARRLNLPGVVDREDSPVVAVVATTSERSGGAGAATSSRGSRRRRARSLPGVAREPTPTDAVPKNVSLSGVARHLWQSRSHRCSSPSPRPLELNSSVAIPTIKIFADSRESSNSEAAPSHYVPAARGSIRSSSGGPYRRPPSSSDGVDDQQRVRRRVARMKERRATLILGIVMASFIGCWLPFFSLYPISLLAGFEVPPAVFAFIFWLGYINSALNPIIYTIFNREFRLAFKRLLCVRRKH